MEVTLTFDNGPDAEVTPGVLGALARRGIRATFFVVGERLRDRAARACAERARGEGHRVGNHTLTHAGPLGGRSDAVAEIAGCEALLGGLADVERLFRPVGGGGALGPHLLSRAARDHLAANAYTVVLWNAVPGDWRDPEGWVGTALAQCGAQPHALVVLHDIASGAMRHLDRFLGAASDRGARFRADFPEGCVPMRRGLARPELDAFVAGETAGGA
jgi:peptidoglycan/xylan/chitin deacetylase (PgdA/CDA1 family)